MKAHGEGTMVTLFTRGANTGTFSVTARVKQVTSYIIE